MRKKLLLSGAVLALLASPFIGAYILVENRLNRIYVPPEEILPVTGDPDQVVRGEHLVTVLMGCTDCHADDLGGKMLYDDSLFGRIAGSNLTTGAGGVGAAYTVLDWERAVRHGLDQEDRPLIFVMASYYAGVGDADVAAMIAYLRQLPPVDRELPETTIGPLTRFFILADPQLLPAQVIDHDHGPLSAPEAGLTAEYGAYLATACTICHGADFSGGLYVGSGLNLTPGGDLRDWDEGDFINALRTGRVPGGRQLDDEKMPWKRLRELTDDELRAIWLHLQSLPTIQSTPAAEGG
ncbi:MAG TPA: c-type cytochrome [Anaerolineales bacterium]|nr:c-type cytochrome [Anaerolineales bacterium]